MSCESLSHVRLFVTLWTVAHQAPLSMDFSRQEYQSGLPFPFPWDLPDSRMEPRSPALQVDSVLSESQRCVLSIERLPNTSCSTTLEADIIPSFTLGKCVQLSPEGPDGSLFPGIWSNLAFSCIVLTFRFQELKQQQQTNMVTLLIRNISKKTTSSRRQNKNKDSGNCRRVCFHPPSTTFYF